MYFCTSNVLNTTPWYAPLSGLTVTHVPDMRFSDEDSSQAAGAVGLRGLLTRGLKAKLIFNCVQSVVFNVVWERLQAMSR